MLGLFLFVSALALGIASTLTVGQIRYIPALFLVWAAFRECSIIPPPDVYKYCWFSVTAFWYAAYTPEVCSVRIHLV